MPSLSDLETEEYICTLIHNEQENEFVDFKQYYYHDEKKYDLIKDVMSFANDSSTIDKYLVFGIVNGTWEISGIDSTSLPDVSDINDMLHTYVEPFIHIEVGNIIVDEKIVGYIKIPFARSDRPYIVKKDYCKNGKTHLRCGEIYVRKSANNFIATRRDLDYIYRNNGSFSFHLYDSIAEIGFIQIRQERKIFVQLRMLFANNTNHTINICRALCDICTSDSVMQYECLYCENKSREFAQVPPLISNVPIQLTPGDEFQKSFYFFVSEQSAEILLNKHRSGQRFIARLEVFDVNKNRFASQPSEIKPCFYGNANIL